MSGSLARIHPFKQVAALTSHAQFESDTSHRVNGERNAFPVPLIPPRVTPAGCHHVYHSARPYVPQTQMSCEGGLHSEVLKPCLEQTLQFFVSSMLRVGSAFCVDLTLFVYYRSHVCILGFLSSHAVANR